MLVLQQERISTVFKLFNNHRFVTRRGFTLIEILVATTLLVLLSGVVIASFRQANISARDTKRKADLQQAKGIIENYRLENGTYPGNTGTIYLSDDGTFLSDPALNMEDYVSVDFLDPVNVNPLRYRYIPRNVAGCAYELGAMMESASNAQTCNCPSPLGGNYYCIAN